MTKAGEVSYIMRGEMLGIVEAEGGQADQDRGSTRRCSCGKKSMYPVLEMRSSRLAARGGKGSRPSPPDLLHSVVRTCSFEGLAVVGGIGTLHSEVDRWKPMADARQQGRPM